MLKARELISPKKAKSMVEDFTLFSNHLHTNLTKNLKKKDLTKFYKARGLSFHKLCQEARRFKKPIPNVENLLGAGEYVYMPDNEDDALYLTKNGEKRTVLKGSGKFSRCDYQAKFELACRARNRAIEESSIDEIHSAISLYIASYESFFHDVSTTFNYHSGRPVLIDTKNSPVSLERKIKDWIPILSQGKSLDLGGIAWNNFKTLLEMRHNASIHPKQDAIGMTYSEMADILNRFPTAFGELFFEMHRLLNIEICAAIVRTKYYPEVYVERDR